MSSNELPDDAPPPRLCHLVKWLDFDGYGFNLHAEKSKPGQYIGKVDEASPAEAAGLKSGDRIIEVNGVNIANENHKQVVERVKAVLNETKLLVVDDETDKWYKERKIVVKGTQSNVAYKKTPVPRPGSDEPPQYTEVNGISGSDHPSTPTEHLSQVHISEVEEKEERQPNKSDEQQPSPVHNKRSANSSTASTPSIDRKEETIVHSKEEDEELKKEETLFVPPPVEPVPVSRPPESPVVHEKTSTNHREELNSTPSPKGSPKEVPVHDDRPKSAASASSGGSSSRPSSMNGTPPTTPTPATANGRDKLNLNMTAQEMRALLATRKKYDPKKDAMDLRQKYAIIQDM